MRSALGRTGTLVILCLSFSLAMVSSGSPTISPPTVDGPLWACATAVTVQGFVPGAKIDIYVNGTTLVGGGVSDSPWGQSYAVNPPLSAGQIVTATQSFGGDTSLPSAEVHVASFGKDQPEKLPKPVISTPLYDCGGALAVTNLAKGGLLRTFANGSPIGEAKGCGEGQWLWVHPLLVKGQGVYADETLCTGTSPHSATVTVDPAPKKLPTLVVGEIYDGGHYCVIDNITNGALVSVFNNGTFLDKQYYPGGGQVVRLSPPPHAGDQITSIQSLCKTKSKPSPPSVVKPCSDLLPPALGPICPGDTSVKITKAVVDARIQVFADGVLVADGGGPVVNLFQPAKLGETYTAVQIVGACKSDPSAPLAVGCVPPAPLQPNIPNGGRAVAIGIDPSDSKNIMVASETGGVFRSADKGVNWSHASGATTFVYTDVTYVPGSPKVVIATANTDTRRSSGGGIWRSTDGGSTWARPPLTFPTADCAKKRAAYGLSVEPETKRVWAGTLCGLVYSDDAGATWTYLAPGTGYNYDTVFAVQSPEPKRLVILTGTGVKVSKDAGVTFTQSTTGLPGGIEIGVHNQIAVAQGNKDHVFWAFNYGVWDATAAKWNPHIALYRSTDFGTTWSSVIDNDGINRPPFVRLAGTLSDATGKYDVYFGDGGCSLKRATADTGTGAAISSWTALNFDHCDPADLGFDNDHRTPLLLATDGGLHKTKDKGSNWTFAGGGNHGYNALQITEVTGQLHKGGSGTDLYFATQDNDIWASPDTGASWTNDICCEGFFLNVPRAYYPASQTKLTGVACSGCSNFISDPVLAGQGNFPNPPNDIGNPRLLKPAAYIQNTADPANTGSTFALTKDTGSTWNSRYNFAEDPRDLSKIAGAVDDPVVYTPVKKPGATPDGQEIVQLKRIAGVLGSGTPTVSDVGGIKSMGVFATMFAWYKPFGVDPANSNFLIVPDTVDTNVKVSGDSGGTWTADAVLTNSVTNGKEFRFYWSPFTQLSSIGFDPDCKGHIFVGTQQAGILVTNDSGATWGRVAGTEVIPFVSSFFFPGGSEVIASSYGRGLWKMSYTCLAKAKGKPKKPWDFAEPVLWWKGAKVPLSLVNPPESCEKCGYLLTIKGRILDYTLDRATNEVLEVVVDGGGMAGYTVRGREFKAPFRVIRGQRPGKFSGDEELVELLSDAVQAKGLFLEGTVLKGVLLSSGDVDVKQLPKARPLGPHISVDVKQSGRLAAGPGKVSVRGEGFDSRYPLEVTLDGKPLEVKERLAWDNSGTFTFPISAPLRIGGHTILVRQKTEKGVLEDATTFLITVSDTKEKK